MEQSSAPPVGPDALEPPEFDHVLDREGRADEGGWIPSTVRIHPLGGTIE